VLLVYQILSGQITCSICFSGMVCSFMLAVVYGRQTVQELDCLTLEDWTDMLP